MSCARKTFAEKLSIALPFARKTNRVGELVWLFGHAGGGRVNERLPPGLGIPLSDSAVLRQLKSHVCKRRETEPLRAIAIDDWSWGKGVTYGTIIVDLERHTVADALESRSVQATADRLRRHPGIEVFTRDRCGLYAQGIREGAVSVDKFGSLSEDDRPHADILTGVLLRGLQRSWPE
jgi:hypothetical protein